MFLFDISNYTLQVLISRAVDNVLGVENLNLGVATHGCFPYLSFAINYSHKEEATFIV